MSSPLASLGLGEVVEWQSLQADQDLGALAVEVLLRQARDVERP